MTSELTAGARPPSVLRADSEGVLLKGPDDVVLDVLFDGRRVWSFWSLRDSVAAERGTRLAAWPPALAKRLTGHARVGVGLHAVADLLYDEPVAFDDVDAPLELLDGRGQPLGVDNTGKLMPTFETRSEDQTRPLLDSLELVLDQLAKAGIAAFPAYGSLLGAVRERRLIGHDSDADIGYVSRHTHPYDVVRESMRLQRQLREAGFEATRYSGASLRVTVIESDGFRRGLDIFGGYLDGENLNLMGEIRVPFKPEWIFPLGECELEGRTLPAPAQPDRLLEVTYGEGWRVPDPAFVFTTPETTIRAFNSYFRVTRARRKQWALALGRERPELDPPRPSALAEFVVAQEGVPEELFDLGAGRCRDALWFAQQGSRVTAYDYITVTANPAIRRARTLDLPLDVRRLNLQEWRSMFVEGARVARDPRPRTLIANHLFDAAPRFGRESLARFASMSLRSGGRLYADFWCGGGAASAEDPSHPVGIDHVRQILINAGADILSASELDGAQGDGRRTGRVVAQWQATTV